MYVKLYWLINENAEFKPRDLAIILRVVSSELGIGVQVNITFAFTSQP
jgi:hypothetical protein